MGLAFHFPYGPWAVAAYLPLGTLLFLWRRKKKVGQSIEPLALPGPADTTPVNGLSGSLLGNVDNGP
jgi:hypothetical protein